MEPTLMRCAICTISLFRRLRAKLENGSYICQHCAVGEVKRLRGQLEKANEALRAYNAVKLCPGILIEPGHTSGCNGGIPIPCLTCIAVAAAENE